MSPEHNPPHPVYSESENPILVRPEQIPPELLPYPQWVCWRYVEREEGRKPDKQPVNPHSLNNAGVHWANTWSSFDQALEVYLAHQARGLHGIGFVLTQGDPFVGLDLDSCITGQEITSSALELVQYLQSYTEISPSGRGLHIFVNSAEWRENRRKAGLEIYSHNRFMTVTGQHVEGTPATISTVSSAEVSGLMPQLQDASSAYSIPTIARSAVVVDDLQLWERIFQHDQYGAQHARRFQGDTVLDRQDHSLAVIRLLNCLARWTQCDAERMRSMMLLSPLANEKWFNKRGKGDWLDHQITDAIAFVKRGKSSC